MVVNGTDDGTREHAVVIAGGGPTGMVLAAELTLAGVDAVVVERRTSHELESSRAGGLHARTIEVFDQRGVAERFLAAGEVMQIVGYSQIQLDLSDFPSRHPYGLALWQSHIERIMGEWIAELGVAMLRGREVVGLLQDDDGVDVALDDGTALRARYVVGCDGGRSLVRKAAGIDFPGTDPTMSWILAEVEMDEEPSSASGVTASASMPSVDASPTSRSGSCSTSARSTTRATRRWTSCGRRSSPCTGRTSGCAGRCGSPGSRTSPARRPSTAGTGSCWPATPRTSTRRWVARASTSACRTP
jgi:2-polyprenyl-6-methoxyphenol hydroxylase-like FAD-dependent oxidoreductase